MTNPFEGIGSVAAHMEANGVTHEQAVSAVSAELIERRALERSGGAVLTVMHVPDQTNFQALQNRGE